MKNILKFYALALLLFVGASCENDDQTIATPVGGPELLTPADGNDYILLPDNAANEVTTLVWNHADYNVQTQINYEVEVALATTDFTTIESGGSTTSRHLTWSVEQLNVVMMNLGAIPYQPTDIDVRIKSSLGANNDLVDYSNVITITVTPYSTDLPKIAVPGNHQGWNPPTAPRLAASAFGETNYEGYVWLDGGHKFIAPNSSGAFEWGNTDWGDDGSFSGVLAETGESDCTVPAGYYRVRANTTALTYDETLVSWGVIGSATAGVTGGSGWDNDANMTYDSNTGKWTLLITLGDGEIKFRYNDSWNNGADQYNLGGFDGGADPANYGGEMMTYGGANIAVTAGTYLIELDLSSPRDYTYTLTPQ